MENFNDDRNKTTLPNIANKTWSEMMFSRLRLVGLDISKFRTKFPSHFVVVELTIGLVKSTTPSFKKHRQGEIH